MLQGWEAGRPGCNFKAERLKSIELSEAFLRNSAVRYSIFCGSQFKFRNLWL